MKKRIHLQSKGYLSMHVQSCSGKQPIGFQDISLWITNAILTVVLKGKLGDHQSC